MRQLRSTLDDHLVARHGRGHVDHRGADEGVHSGEASGIVPSSFRILRRLLSRLEDEETGAIRPAELYVQIPPERVAQARRASAALGDAVYTKFPLKPGMSPMDEDLTELVLNRTWRPQLASMLDRDKLAKILGLLARSKAA
jgi:hypothetical protein